jgi:AmmeMemoRadiSam system protein A
MITQEEKRELLSIARESIAHALVGAGRRTDDKPLKSRKIEGRLSQPSGAFVTLRMGRELRGCIGFIVSDHPLAEVVSEVAVKAATEDPRFVPMTQSELARATVEISVLSPLRQVTNFDEIEVGRHGLIVELGRSRGLLLPQVATEYGWDRETFLDQTARKAGLPLKAWRDPDAKVFLFSAEIIEEEPE